MAGDMDTLMFNREQLESMVATTITIDSSVRDRLRGFRVGTYDETLTHLMDQVEKERFIAEMQRELDDPATVWVEHEDIEWG